MFKSRNAMLRCSVAVCLVGSTMCLLGARASAQNLIGMGPNWQGNGLFRIDPATGNLLGGIVVRLPGEIVQGCNGMTTHPMTGELYALLTLNGQGLRELVTINPATGVATSIGPAGMGGQRFAGIAFNADGSVLYGVTGDGSADSESLFEINQMTGAATFLCEFGNGDDGETIAFNPDDMSLYHGSGNNTQVFERVDDPSMDPCVITDIPLSDDIQEFLGLVYSNTNDLFYCTGFDELFTISAMGNVTMVGTMPVSIKGLAFNAAAPPGPPPCPPLAALYVATSLGNDPSDLWAVDPNTGNARLVGPIGFDGVSAMDFGPDGQLYGLGENPNTGNEAIITINPCTGQGTQVAELSGMTIPRATDMSFRNSDGTLFAFTKSGGTRLFTINRSTGAATLVGASTGQQGSDGNGIAFAPNDVLFHADGDSLHTLNQATGAATQVDPLDFAMPVIGGARVNCMDFQPGTGTLYAIVNDDGVDWYLGTVNTTTGAITRIGSTISRADALAFSPPTGACCLANNSCQVISPTACTAANGSYRGNNTTCTPNPCGTGACCFLDGTCQALSSSQCTAQSGLFRGAGVACDPNPCLQPSGACCLSDGTCTEVAVVACVALGGTFAGADVTCAQANCGGPEQVVDRDVLRTVLSFLFGFPLCAPGMAVALPLMMIGLAGMKLRRRRRR